MPKSIRFTAQGSSSQLGNFSSGDIARNIPDALADHLVNEAMCAEYLPDAVKAAPAAQPVTPAQADPAPAPAKRGKKPTVEQKGE